MFSNLFGRGDKKKPAAVKASTKPVTARPPKAIQATDVKPVRASTGPIISNAEEIPEHRSVATAEGGLFHLSAHLQTKMAAIEVNLGQYQILVTTDFWQNNNHLTLAQDVKQKGYKVVAEKKIDDGTLQILYSRWANKETLKDADVENPILTKQVEKIVLDAVTDRATDIHICPRFNTANRTGAILFRIDGKLRVYMKYPADALATLVGYIYTKKAEQSSRSEPAFNKDSAQSCSVVVMLDDRAVRIRYQSTPVNGGFDVVMRLLVLDSQDKTKSLEDLGYEPTQVRDLDLASRKTVGVIIVAGVTGSGKSTTLKTLMTRSPRRHLVKSYSIEDPVEYQMGMVSQISVQRSSDDKDTDSNPFLRSMRVLMRLDPDVIMAGEVRDNPSCQMLQTMVQSGHQVMTTVHTSSAIEILDRLSSESMGLTRQTLSGKNFISALVFQRLIPLLCEHCKIPAVKIVPEDRLELLETKFGISRKNVYGANEANNKCPHCGGTGIHGRTVASEIILPDRDFLRLVRNGDDLAAEEYWRTRRVSGFDDPDMTGKTAFEHGLYKVACGLVDPRHLEDEFDPMEMYQLVERK
ncbi:GspE/PulE family protein [Methylobacillus sp. Pita2]|uniref:GspE/PulE family protein n=1 Tax=Methylobacillus sp. Pita2 TaxID=3383245 RepID=UPI0038B6A727